MQPHFQTLAIILAIITVLAMIYIIIVIYKYFRHKNEKTTTSQKAKKHTPYCLVIGHPGSGAKHFIQSLNDSVLSKSKHEHHLQIISCEHLDDSDEHIKMFFTQAPTDKTIYVCSHLSEKEAKIWRDFLLQIPVRYNQEHPLCHYIPDILSWEIGTAINLTNKDGCWTLHKISMADNQIIY